MGVTGLWSVVSPCARPIKIETLNKKRLAVDASIWIYQFLKAVRDKEGNALRNSHVVGFFRRICKLLFIGILPVFVFDGGAPTLKRQTISARKSRREGRKEDAVRTAGKLLALQMQRAAEEDEQKRKQDAQRPPMQEEEEVPDDMVYVDELQMTQQERQQSRKFKKKDQYHLPELDVSLAEMGGPNDPRIMSLEELEAYARQFDAGEDIDVYDFSKIDFDSPFFVSLPASDRYNILNAARLRSRLRLGYSKEQLDTMFPDRMAFSKFQIERVRERNELTQRLMNINGMNDDAMFGVNGSGRVAGEKGREYVLIKNDGVEGGWALGVVTSKDEGQENKPIDVDELGRQAQQALKDEEEDEEDDDDFEDVPVEGLNRLLKRNGSFNAGGNAKVQEQIAKKRNAFYASRGRRAPRRRAPVSKTAQQDPDSLFVADEVEQSDEDLWEEVPVDGTMAVQQSDDEELNRAIAMSLEADKDDVTNDVDAENSEEEDLLKTFQQTRADEARPVPRGSGRSIANVVNSRANKVVPVAKDHASSGSDEDDMDLQAALAESRKTRHKPKAQPLNPRKEAQTVAPQSASAAPVHKQSAFSGALPFEKLDLGSSLLGKKKMQKLQDDSAGGFEKDLAPKKQEVQALPPWFAGNLDEDIAAQRAIEQKDRQKAKEFSRSYQFTEPSVLRRQPTKEIIDIDDANDPEDSQPVIRVDSSDEEAESPQQRPVAASDNATPVSMGELADAIRAAPPEAAPAVPGASESVPQIQRDMKDVMIASGNKENQQNTPADRHPTADNFIATTVAEPVAEVQSDDDEPIEWEESDREDEREHAPYKSKDGARSESPDFEDVEIPDRSTTVQQETVQEPQQEVSAPVSAPFSAPFSAPVSAAVEQNAPPDQEPDEYGLYSDSEDEELMRQLAVESEEHARFASTLNHKTQEQNAQDYERELKQLRSQQKRDRRDADEVTHIMITECQQLLKLFGLPYITAPMEAEAQCAELVNLGLVDGIVTDDSDCFLFGGTRIYKNMFNQAKFVECYLTSDLEKEFDLTRQKLIGIAQLLGSDYTEGLTGVGPVSALEILSEFPSLKDFKEWWEAVQMNTITKADDAGNAFRKKFRRNATKLFLPPSFPDPRVELAYTNPEVDSDTSQFQWGVPDLDALRSFLMATIGWTQERTDEVLVPVIRDMNTRMSEGTQSNITAFFTGGTGAGAYAPRKKAEQGSKRLGSALGRMAQQAKRRRTGGEADNDEDVGDGNDASAEPEPIGPVKKQKKRKARVESTA